MWPDLTPQPSSLPESEGAAARLLPFQRLVIGWQNGDEFDGPRASSRGALVQLGQAGRFSSQGEAEAGHRQVAHEIHFVSRPSHAKPPQGDGDGREPLAGVRNS